MSPTLAGYIVWAAWGASWLLAGVWRSRAVSVKAPRGTRLSLLAAFFGFAALFAEPPGGIDALWMLGAPVAWSLVGLTAVGAAFAWWARLHLGNLWSGGIVRREGHRVVDSGPYGLVRHPIYTGIILAAMALGGIKGSALAIGGAILLSVAFAAKARIEERFLAVELGEGAYAAYAARVPMLVPFLPRS